MGNTEDKQTPNEEMFGAQEPEDPDLPESQEPETEEPEGEEGQEPEPSPEPATTVDYAALMKELGLTQFKDPADAIRAVREQNRYISQLEHERAEWRKSHKQQPRQSEPEAIDPDDFLTNPDEVLAKRGFVRQQDVDRVVEVRLRERDEAAKIAAFQSAHSDFDDLKTDMAAIYQVNTWLDNIPASEAVAILYDRAKRTRVAAQPATPQVQPADKDKANRASTGGGKPTGKQPTKQSGGLTAEDAIKMTPEEIEERLGFGDR